MPAPSPTPILRRAAVTSLSTVALAGAGAGLAPSGASAATPACRTSQLVATLSGGQGAAGTFLSKLTFTNLGETCTMRGYPGVSAVDIHGRQLGDPGRRQAGGHGVRTVTLGAVGSTHASTAYTTLGIVDTGALPSRCRQTLAAGLRVYPPGQRAALAVPTVFDACSARGTPFLTVQALR